MLVMQVIVASTGKWGNFSFSTVLCFYRDPGEPSTREHLLRLRQKDKEYRLVLFPPHAEPPGSFYCPYGELKANCS